MLQKRVMVSLEVRDGRAVRHGDGGQHIDLGDPVELSRRYEREGADEIVYLDSSDSAEGRQALLEVVQRTAANVFVPLTIAGGINDVPDIALALRAGADKITINTAAVTRPELITEAAQRFGTQSVIARVDARLERRQIELLARGSGPAAPAGAAAPATWFRVFTHNGRNATELDAIEWARRCAELGAGEILITSIDQHGRRTGYDLELTARIAETVTVPVVAAGGAGAPEHVRDAFLLAGADGALIAGMMHDGAMTVANLKRFLSESGVPVREPPVALPSP